MNIISDYIHTVKWFAIIPVTETQTEETTATDNKQFIEIDSQRYELVPAEE